jgi:serine/threonine protein kinase
MAYAATGQSPFGTGPTGAIFYRIMHETPDVSGVPEQLRAIVEGALLKNPAERPTAQDLLARNWLPRRATSPLQPRRGQGVHTDCSPCRPPPAREHPELQVTHNHRARTRCIPHRRANDNDTHRIAKVAARELTR